MHRIRDSLLSPSPKGFPYIGELDSISHDQQDVRLSLARGEFEEVRGAAFYNRTGIVTNRYCNSGDGVDSLEGYTRNIWYSYFQLSLHASPETPEHDHLVLDILRIQGMGPLTRPVRGHFGIDIARMTEGTVWNDLPFLVTDMTDFWINNCRPLSGTQRLNFASYLAKLASTRVCKDRMCQVALIIFRCTFEERKELRTNEDKDEKNPRRSMWSLNIMHLLPAAHAWLKEASHNLMQLSEVSWNDCPSTIGQGGPCFLDSELGKRSPTGFRPWRWIYWLKRLHEIREAAKDASQKHLEGLATEAIEFMPSGAQALNSDIVMVFKTAGHLIYEDKHLLPLKKLAEGEEPFPPHFIDGDESEEGEETKKTEEINHGN
ncbi:Protein of unknown function DUF3632 [Penicillium expansum]|uniref:Uncharacterized protein n=1 Tax=Penicillium expansum TaxID=27334 RepID=A0A0A2K479_PENEN|nr:Protein of unknown function DUF3632 [Penicillium expansum]KGO54332.1 Protein of unknown function DUF3632 [Penicillium expansum]KGO61871.1 Protein of unknown function DUF3632 [Penicillium expansum]